MNHDNPAAFSQACLDFPTEDWCTCEVVGFWNRKPGAPYNHFDLNIGARSFLNDHFGMFAHKPISSNIGQSIPFWFDRVKTESAFIGIFNPLEEVGHHQGCKDFISSPCLATDGHCDLGWIWQHCNGRWIRLPAMVILLVWRCRVQTTTSLL